MRKLISAVIAGTMLFFLGTSSVEAKGKPPGVGPKEHKTSLVATAKVEAPAQGQLTKELKTQRPEEQTKEKGVKVRGMNLKFDVPPVIKEGRMLIPIRAVMNGLGAQVEWNSETKEVTVTRGDKIIVLNLQDGTATVNGETITLDVAAQNIENRTFVPLRFIAQTLGEKVAYNEETGEVTIGDGAEAAPEEGAEQGEPEENQASEDTQTEEENISEENAPESEQTAEDEEEAPAQESSGAENTTEPSVAPEDSTNNP